MDFPTGPAKRTSGKLKLIIKPPGTEVVLEPTPPEPGTDDGVLKIKLPPGFSSDDSFESLLARQEKNALAAIDEIEARYNRCGACKKKGYQQEVIDNARWMVKLIKTSLLENVSAPVKIIIGHDKNGEISVDASYQDRSLFIIIRNKGSEVGHYHKGKLIKVEDNLTSAIEWLQGV